MWERQYIEFAQTTEGGRQSEDDAVAQWATWKKMKSANPTSVIWDMEGPNKDKPLQFRVSMSKQVDFVNKYEHTNAMESVQKLGKTVSLDQLEKLVVVQALPLEKKRKDRVRETMKSKGLSLPEASNHRKQNKFYYQQRFINEFVDNRS